MMPDPPAGPERVAAGAAGVPGEAGPLPPGAADPAVPPDGGTPEASPGDLYDLGGRLLERGEAARAAEVFAAALERAGADHPARGQLLGGLGIARLEQALVAFAEAAHDADSTVRPLVLELLARTLPLRDRDDEAAAVWQQGMHDPDPDVAAAVWARLRRSFGEAAVPEQEFWWDGFLESAVCHGTLPALAAELFGAIDLMYALVAVPHVRKARQRELREALAQAVRVPGRYAWGPDLHESFRRRLRDLTGAGAGADVLPPS